MLCIQAEKYDDADDDDSDGSNLSDDSDDDNSVSKHTEHILHVIYTYTCTCGMHMVYIWYDGHIRRIYTCTYIWYTHT
jgi:hypothetical protein